MANTETDIFHRKANSDLKRYARSRILFAKNMQKTGKMAVNSGWEETDGTTIDIIFGPFRGSYHFDLKSVELWRFGNLICQRKRIDGPV